MGIDKNLVVRILGDSSQLKATYADVKKETTALGKEIDKHGASIQAIGKTMLAVGGTIVGAMTATVIAVAKTSREIEHMAEETGTSIETIQRLSAAAKKHDVTNEQLVTGLVKLSRSMVSASDGTGAAADAFDQLHIRVTNADGTLRKNSDVLLDVADKFSTMTDGTKRAALAQQLFGKSGADMIPMLEVGRKGIIAYGDSAQAMGSIISEKAVKQLAELDRKIQTVAGASTNFGKGIAADLVPYLSKFADGLLSVEKSFNSLPAPIRQGIVLFTGLAGAIMLVSGAVITFGAAIGAAAVAAAPYIAAGAAIVAIVTGISAAIDKENNGIKNQIEATKKQRESMESLTSEYQELKNKTSLTTDEKKRLLEVQNQISEIAPDVVAGYDKEGNAIIDLNAALKTQVELKRQELQLSQQQISKEIADIEKKIAANNKDFANQKAMNDYYNSQANYAASISNKVGSAEEYKKKTLSEYNAELRKHNSTNEEAQEKLKRLKQQYEDISNLLAGKIVTTVKKTTKTTTELTEEQLAKQKEAAEKSAKLTQEWADKLFNETHSALEQLNHEEQQALNQSNLTEKAKTDIKAYYAKKREELTNEEAKKEEDIIQSANDKVESITEDGYQKIFQDEKKSIKDRTTALNNYYAARLKKLTDSFKKEETQVKKDSKADLALQDAYNAESVQLENERQKELQAIRDTGNEAEINSINETITNMAVALGSGQETIKDIMKDMLCSELDIYENTLKAEIVAGVAKAWAQAGGNPYVAIPLSVAINAEGLLGIAALEAGKAAIRGLAEGGLATGPSYNLIGEGKYPEAVIPLSDDVLSKIGNSIVNATNNTNNNSSTMNNSSKVTNNYYKIGGYIDKSGLKKLVRDINPIMTSENRRKGIKN